MGAAIHSLPAVVDSPLLSSRPSGNPYSITCDFERWKLRGAERPSTTPWFEGRGSRRRQPPHRTRDRRTVSKSVPSTPQRIRTSNLRFRRPMLYPIELGVRSQNHP